MSTIPSPPDHRITLFYGPEEVPGTPSYLRCTFNVKKRSWKGGIQVAVEISHSQLLSAQGTLDFEPWLQAVLDPLPEEDTSCYDGQIRDVLVQKLCELKLGLAIARGLSQTNQHLLASDFQPELDTTVLHYAASLKTTILTEVDLPV